MNSLKEFAKQAALSWCDTYCGTGFCFIGPEFLKEILKNPINHETASAIMEGVLEGFAKAEMLNRQNLPYSSPSKCINVIIENEQELS